MCISPRHAPCAATGGLRKVFLVIQAAQASGGSNFTPLLLIVLLFGVMYFMMIRPQQKRRREAQQMQSQLGTGDQIVTIGGLHATVVAVDDDVVTVEIAPGVQVRFARPAIARVVSQQAAAEEVAVVDDEVVEELAIESPVVETRKSKD
jgi:preprotein translocase subunit YajC